MANAEHLKILKEGVERWNRWREENKNIAPNLRGAFLESATLINANLNGADLTNANLFGAILRKAKLNGATLSCATLDGADLSGAMMHNTKFQRANLRKATLSGAELNNAVLVDANLRGANLNGTILNLARIGHTIFGLTNLSNCTGLETVEITAPCSIDFQTLRASRNLPKSFLLKIGLPELYIDHLPEFFHNEGIKYYSAFLSHSWDNKPFASKLYEALIAKGVNVFFDGKKMKPGDDIFNSLSRGIELYDKTILVCSEDSLNSWWVDQELELVFEKERKLQKEVGKKIGLLIPIRIDDHIDTWNNGKRMAIKQCIIGDFRNWQDDTAFEKALNDLIHALNADRPEIKPVSHLPGKPKP